MSRTSRINELLDAFGDQSEIIRKQNDIIDRLFTLLSMHLSSEELADLKYTVATENCADRTAAYQNTRDIIDSQTRGTQAILDKLCQLELDGVKAQVEARWSLSTADRLKRTQRSEFLTSSNEISNKRDIV